MIVFYIVYSDFKCNKRKSGGSYNKRSRHLYLYNTLKDG